MKTKDTIKQAIRNISFVSLYAACFSLVFAFGLFAMNGGLEQGTSAESANGEPQDEVLTVYDLEIDETTPSPARKVSKRI